MSTETEDTKLPEIPADMPAGKIIGTYIAMRDRIKAREDVHKKELQPAKKMLEALGNRLLDELNKAGGNGIQADTGTAYRTERTTASISDGQAFRDYVIANELWDVLDWKANGTAVKDHINEFGAPPPGVNLNTVFTVGVRRANEK